MKTSVLEKENITYSVHRFTTTFKVMKQREKIIERTARNEPKVAFTRKKTSVCNAKGSSVSCDPKI